MFYADGKFTVCASLLQVSSPEEATAKLEQAIKSKEAPGDARHASRIRACSKLSVSLCIWREVTMDLVKCGQVESLRLTSDDLRRLVLEASRRPLQLQFLSSQVPFEQSPKLPCGDLKGC